MEAENMPQSAPGPPEDKAADPVQAIGGELCRRVRELRAERGWSLEALARASGVSRSMLSQIERNQANPTLAVALRIARAFDVSIGELVHSAGATSAIQVVRAGDRAYHYRSDQDCRIRTLSPLHLVKFVFF
jgi:transcriptional regulator with XRE-family HTH domain